MTLSKILREVGPDAVRSVENASEKLMAEVLPKLTGGAVKETVGRAEAVGSLERNLVPGIAREHGDVGTSNWIGTRYEEQQDNHWVSPENRVGVVADGMGGFKGGRTASRIITDVFERRYAKFPTHGSHDAAEHWLSESVWSADNALRDAQMEGSYVTLSGEQLTVHNGMGSTAVGSVRNQNKMFFEWSGDSRAVVLRDGKLIELTTAHENPTTGSLSRYMSRGQHDSPEARLESFQIGDVNWKGRQFGDRIRSSIEFKEGDRFLIHTDGLERLTDEEIKSILMRPSTAQESSDSLIKAVQDKVYSGHKVSQDNVTAIVIDTPVPSLKQSLLIRSEPYGARVVTNIDVPATSMKIEQSDMAFMLDDAQMKKAYNLTDAELSTSNESGLARGYKITDANGKTMTTGAAVIRENHATGHPEVWADDPKEQELLRKIVSGEVSTL